MAKKTSAKVYFNAEGFKELAEDFRELGIDTSRLADKVLGNVAAEGRKYLGKAQENSSGLKMGKRQYKWKVKQGKGFYTEQKFSEMDESHGWYKSTTGTRIIGFNFENLSYIAKSRRTKYREGSRGYVYSLLANLFGKPVTYKKRSPWFKREDYQTKGSWGKGDIRPARQMSMTTEVVGRGLPTAMNKSNENARQMLKEGGWI